MATSYRQFVNELYEEHVEEASFLYEQRLAFLTDPDLAWFAYYSEELRLDAHLDGLIIGGERALLITQETALEGDIGAIYTLISLYCLVDQRDEFLGKINEFDLQDHEVQQAIQLALLHRMPDSWHDSFLQNKFNEQQNLLSLFLPVLIKLDKIPSNIEFEQIFDGTFTIDDVDPIPFIQASSYFPDKNSNKLLTHFMVNGSEEQKDTAVFSLYRLGRKHIVEQTILKVKHQELPLMSIAAGASNAFFTALITKHETASWDENSIHCLAVGGVAEFIPELIKLLKDDALAEFAANALFIITGARLIENVLQEDIWVKDDLFEDEVEAFNQGIMPQRTDGRAFGEEVEKLSASFEVWLDWWDQNYSQYVSGKRYRLGMLISPVSLVRTLHSDFGGNVIRELSYQELVIRYKTKLFLSTKDCIQVQQKSIQALYQWATQVDGKYSQGEWYFSGNMQQ
tara:strand:- start:8221 stop:9585 length:1365 start_codon:yes stop_codon:yes gene_type:complete